MNNRDFSLKIAAVLNDYSALPIEAKAETLTSLRRTIKTIKSRRTRETLRELEDFFKFDLKPCRTFN